MTQLMSNKDTDLYAADSLKNKQWVCIQYKDAICKNII